MVSGQLPGIQFERVQCAKCIYSYVHHLGMSALFVAHTKSYILSSDEYDSVTVVIGISHVLILWSVTSTGCCYNVEEVSDVANILTE
jgi:hypothetical protein